MDWTSEQLYRPVLPTVVSFCSFADSGARHRAMANIGVMLQNAGFRVGLCAIDSAPFKLGRYFAQYPSDEQTLARRPGLWNLVNEYKNALTGAAKAAIVDIPIEPMEATVHTTEFGSLSIRRPSTYLTSVLETRGDHPGSIHLLPPGVGVENQDGSFSHRPDWARFD